MYRILCHELVLVPLLPPMYAARIVRREGNKTRDDASGTWYISCCCTGSRRSVPAGEALSDRTVTTVLLCFPFRSSCLDSGYLELFLRVTGDSVHQRRDGYSHLHVREQAPQDTEQETLQAVCDQSGGQTAPKQRQHALLGDDLLGSGD